MRYFLLLILLLPSARTASAQLESAAFPVTQLDATARSAGLGGASPAIIERGSGALFTNPALLTPDMHGMAELTYLNHVSDLSAGWLSYARTIDSVGTFAIGLRYLSFGDMDRTDVPGETTGTFSASDIGLTAGMSRAWKSRLRYGASVSLLHNSIDSEGASALTMDAGLRWHDEARRLSFGATLNQVGVVLSSIGSRRDHLPTDLRIGASKRLRHLPLLVSATAYRLNKLDGATLFHHLILAAEFQFSESFRMRFGYNHRRHDDLKIKSRLDMAGVSTGVGIRVRRVSVDYGYSSWSSLGGLHRLTVQTAIR